MISRRNFMVGSGMAGGGLLAGRPVAARQNANIAAEIGSATAPIQETGTASVVTPNGVSLPFRVVDGVKVFHLIAEPVDH